MIFKKRQKLPSAQRQVLSLQLCLSIQIPNLDVLLFQKITLYIELQYEIFDFGTAKNTFWLTLSTNDLSKN